MSHLNKQSRLARKRKDAKIAGIFFLTGFSILVGLILNSLLGG